MSLHVVALAGVTHLFRTCRPKTIARRALQCQAVLSALYRILIDLRVFSVTNSLFRTEAVDAQRQRLYGDVIVARPLSFTLIASFLAVIMLGLVVFLASGSYARKETAGGYLQPDKGVVEIVAPVGGVVESVHVSEGDLVAAGDALLTILSERVTSHGRAVDASMLASLTDQLEELDRRGSLLHRQNVAEQKRLQAEHAGLAAELDNIEQQQKVQQDLVAVAVENLNAIADLTERGVVSETEYKARQERVLGYRQQLASLAQQRSALEARRQQTVLALERLPLEAEEAQSQLASARADLERQRMEIEGRRAITLVAPINGRVTALQATRGGQASNRPLLSILPQGGVLEAHLYIPTRAIGFVEEGQAVRLAYDAFNYRRFGVYDGIVREVSATILSPDNVPGPIAPQEPVYRVTVAIDRQTIEAYGKAVALQAGMTLTADIILEKRSLIEWLLDPILSLRGRV